MEFIRGGLNVSVLWIQSFSRNLFVQAKILGDNPQNITLYSTTELHERVKEVMPAHIHFVTVTFFIHLI